MPRVWYWLLTFSQANRQFLPAFLKLISIVLSLRTAIFVCTELIYTQKGKTPGITPSVFSKFEGVKALVREEQCGFAFLKCNFILPTAFAIPVNKMLKHRVFLIAKPKFEKNFNFSTQMFAFLKILCYNQIKHMF